MSWVICPGLDAWVWEVGAFQPTIPGELPAPRTSLLPPDCGELDYMLSDTSGIAADLDTYEWYDTYTYRSGSGFGNSGPRTVWDEGMILYVVYWNLDYEDPSTWGPPSTPGSALVWAGLAAGGTADPPPPPPDNDNFTGRLPLSGRCGKLTVPSGSMESATVEWAWETWLGQQKTTWYEWVAPFTGWVFFRGRDGLVVQLWQGPLVDGHPVILAPSTWYGSGPGGSGEHTCWAEVTEGASYYVQVVLDNGAEGGTVLWQPLDDEPEQTLYGSTSYLPTGTSIPEVIDSYPQVYRTNVFAPDTGNYGNPLIETDNVSVGYHPLSTFSNYMGLGLYGVSITTLTPDPTSTPVPDDAILDGVGFSMNGALPSAGESHMPGAAAQLPGGNLFMGSQLVGPYGVHPVIINVSGTAALSGELSVADAQTGNWQIILGEARVTYPATNPTGPYEGGEWQAERLRGTVNWHHVVGAPVPPWSCGTPPLRMKQRDDGPRRYGAAGPSSVQSSVRRYGRGGYA